MSPLGYKQTVRPPPRHFRVTPSNRRSRWGREVTGFETLKGMRVRKHSTNQRNGQKI